MHMSRTPVRDNEREVFLSSVCSTHGKNSASEIDALEKLLYTCHSLALEGTPPCLLKGPYPR